MVFEIAEQELLEMKVELFKEGSFLLSINVNVVIDFESETNLQELKRIFTPQVADTGVNFF